MSREQRTANFLVVSGFWCIPMGIGLMYGVGAAIFAFGVLSLIIGGGWYARQMKKVAE